MTLANKSLMTYMPLPLTLTSIHLCGGAISDLVIIRRQRIELMMWERNSLLFRNALLVGGLSFLTKSLTLLSYSKISISLTHTIKASSPLFVVFFSYVIHGRRVRVIEILALIPITFGVALSSSSDFEFALTGFLASLASTCLGVLQSIITKYSLSKVQIHPLVFHFYTSLVALVTVLPIAVIMESSGIDQLFQTVKAVNGETVTTALPDSPVPIAILATSCFFQYSQAISSMWLLSRISVVGHQVTGVFKRISIIVTSVLYFGKPMSVANGMGVTIAMAGFMFYVATHTRSPKAGRHGHGHGEKSSLLPRTRAQSNATPARTWAWTWAWPFSRKKVKNDAEDTQHLV